MRRWLVALLLGVGAAMATYQAVLLAAPRFLMSAAIKRVGQGGTNRMTHAPLATDKSRAIVRPSPDLAYSSCPFDLNEGPVRITVPSIPSGYWSLSIFDARTDVAYVRNSRDSGGRGIDLVLTHGNWTYDPPAGQKPEAVNIKSSRGIALVRVLVDNRTAYAAIDATRRQARCRVVR